MHGSSYVCILFHLFMRKIWVFSHIIVVRSFVLILFVYLFIFIVLLLFCVSLRVKVSCLSICLYFVLSISFFLKKNYMYHESRYVYVGR